MTPVLTCGYAPSVAVVRTRVRPAGSGSVTPTTSGTGVADTTRSLADTEPSGGADMADRTRPRSHPRKNCAVDECDNRTHARGWCSAHYRRWRKYGDPLGSDPSRGKPPEVRFWLYVDQGDDPDGCWEWTGAKNSVTGYGSIHIAMDPATNLPINAYVHRFSYEMHVGPIPDGLTIDHLCRVKHCVNPDHMEPVTHAENSRRAAVHYWREYRRDPAVRDRHGRNADPVVVDDSRFGDSATRTLMAILTQKRPTVRSVAKEVGISTSTAHHHIRRLKVAGLVAFEADRPGTLRPAVAAVTVKEHC